MASKNNQAFLNPLWQSFCMNNYTESYHGNVHRNLLNNPEYYAFKSDYASKTYLRYLRGNIFEFGSGIGQNIYSIKKNAIGIDISDFAARECKKRGINAIKSLDKLKNNYDGALIVHVLEHIEEPSNILRKINSKLKNNARLVLVLPVFKKNKPETINHGKDISGHVYYWNFSAINALLVKNGFKIILNRLNHARGFSLFYKLPFKIALFLIRLAGFITNTKEMIIVAEKDNASKKK